MTLRTTLLAAAASIGLATSAFAVPLASNSSINLNGYVQATGATTLNMATSLDFTAGGAATPGTAGVISSYNSGTGTFAGMSCGTSTCGSIQDIASLTVGAQTITNFVSLSGGTNSAPINFTLTGINSVTRTNGPNFLLFTASGTINYDGYDPTPGMFLFSAQGNVITSFSGTTLAVATPEPASLAVLGGSLAALGLIRRRKQS